MKLFQSLAVAGVLSVVALAANAQSALNENTVKRIIEEGKKCIDGLEPEDLKPFLKPTQAVKDVLLAEASKLRGSEELKKLSEPERKIVFELLKASRACRLHLESLAAFGKEMQVPNKEAAIKADPKAMETLGKVAESHKQVAAAIESATKATPELAHFLHVHGVAP